MKSTAVTETSINRREFARRIAVSTAAAVAMPAIGAASNDPRPRNIIDTHTHFYDPSRAQGVPWPDKSDSFLYRTVLPENFKALAQPLGVTGTVVVEASARIEDNQWILDLAANEKVIVGFVGHLSPESVDFSSQVERFARNSLFRGIRIGGDALQKPIDSNAFEKGIRVLADRGLSLDVLGDTGTLPHVAKLAAKFPSLRIINNHVANARIDGKAPPQTWLDGVRSNSPHKNVFCKVSGLVEGTGAKDGKAPTQTDFYRPILDGVWDAFGPDRLIYGSNWPVSERFASYATVQQIALEYFRPKGQEALDQVFWKNATTAYQWLKRD